MKLFHNTIIQIRKHVYIIICFVSVSAFSQEFAWNVGYEFIADNREYFSPYGFPQTILGSRASLEVGYEIDSLQTIMFGGKYLLIHGASAFEKPFVPTLYYSYSSYPTHNKPDIELYCGSFSRRTFFPYAMYTDSLDYFRPNTQGLNLNISQNNFLFTHLNINQNFVFDWMTLENYGEEEEFLVGINGFFEYKKFLITDNFYYHHQAYENSNGGKDVVDNGTYSVMIGKQFYSSVEHDSSSSVNKENLRAQFNIGNLLTWQGFRPLDTRYSQGLLARFDVYPTIKTQLSATYYKGDGTHLILGDPLYRSGDYLRLDAYYNFKKSTEVRAYFKYSLHIIQGELNHSQKIYVRVNI
ncbi:MAG: hypothetical protein PF481_00430 [Bacteroidales bacterium]|jgi:hypothetical protein|nr:hypothetical protein [Bacteroidales bacterium]